MKFIQCPLVNNSIISPAVGIFCCAIPKFSDNAQSLGTIRQLGQTLILTVPNDIVCGNIVPQDGDFIMAGDIIAEYGNTRQNNTSSNIPNIFKSPSDGFISTVDASGIPFAEPGARLKTGQIIAIIELMKIRMDITFDGPDNAVFLNYLCPQKSTIRKNDGIFEWILREGDYSY